jgi:hypothetical protein
MWTVEGFGDPGYAAALFPDPARRTLLAVSPDGRHRAAVRVTAAAANADGTETWDVGSLAQEGPGAIAPGAWVGLLLPVVAPDAWEVEHRTADVALVRATLTERPSPAAPT